MSSPPTAPPRPAPEPQGRAPEADPAGAPARPRRRARRWSAKGLVFAGMLAVLILAIPVLSYVGYREVRTSRQGQVIDAVTDPDAPGFEATVVPTPTMMVADTNAEGALNGVVILSLGAEDQGGSVAAVPVGTVVPLPLTEIGSGNLEEIYSLSGVEGLNQRVATMATAALPEMVEVGVDQWATLLAPVGPLTVDNPAPIVALDGTQVFPQGEVQVAPEQAGEFLTGGGPFDGGLTRTERQMAFWESWVAKVAEVGGPDAVPGETDRGLGRFVRGLAAGEHTVLEFPVTAIPIPGAAAADTTVFEPATADIPAFIADNIPFPSGVGRARTRILDGVGQAGLTSEAASLIVPAMAEIHSVGNDDEFGQSTTRIVYFDDEDKAAAERFQAALGVGELVEAESGNDTIDVTITLGDDFGDAGATEPATGDTVPTADSTTTTAAIAPGTPGGPSDPSGTVVPDTAFTVPPATVPTDDGGSGNPNEL